MLAAIASWLVPMWRATSVAGELLAYRNELLFDQTVTRYAHPWHHFEPPWYYLTNVIPLLWLPLIAIVPWLWPRWRRALRERDTLTTTLLAWVVIVIAFFSASAGKRGLYVLPAVPALAMAAAPWLPELLRARGTRRLAFALSAAVTVLVAAVLAYLALGGEGAQRLAAPVAIDPLGPLAVLVLGCGVALALFRVRDAWLGWLGVLAVGFLVSGFVVNPRLDVERSGKGFARAVESLTGDVPEVGFVDLREQFALQLARQIVYFGRGRMLDRDREAADAARWLAADSRRALVIDAQARETCFGRLPARSLGRWHREDWYVVQGAPEPSCVARGHAEAPLHYAPPKGALNTDS
jgi:hypothetical protein